MTKLYLLARLRKGCFVTPVVDRIMVSHEHPGSITTNYSMNQYAIIMEYETSSEFSKQYSEAVAYFKEIVFRFRHDAWMRPWFCKSRCASMYLDLLEEALDSIRVGDDINEL